MKKLTAIFFFAIVSMQFSSVFGVESISQDDVMVGKQDSLIDIGPKDKVDLSLGVDKGSASIKDHFLKNAQRYILGIVAVVAISMFFYIGFELASAEGKQDQFTKGIKALIYLAVGLAVIPLSYVVIKITTGFSF